MRICRSANQSGRAHNAGITHFIALCFFALCSFALFTNWFVATLRGADLSAIFPAAFVHFLSLYHISVIDVLYLLR